MLAPRHALQAGLQRVWGGGVSPLSVPLPSRRSIGALATTASNGDAAAVDSSSSSNTQQAAAAAGVAPPNIPKLAQMAQIAVSDEEVRFGVLVMLSAFAFAASPRLPLPGPSPRRRSPLPHSAGHVLC